MPITASKRITIAGKSYQLKKWDWEDRLRLEGNGVLTSLPPGVTLESPDLRTVAAQAVATWRENRKAASEMIRERVRDGTAGIGRPDPDA